MTTPERLRRRQRIEGVFLMVVGLTLIVQPVYFRDQDQKIAVTNCENANESREASRALWGYVVDLSLAGNKDATTAEIAYLTEVREWIDKVYQKHDCDDLARKYPLPPPPTIPETS